MFTPRKNSLPTPSLEDSFFPLSPSSSSLSFALPSSSSPNGSVDSGAGIETDLILAAELGQALLEKNEELAAALDQREREVEVSLTFLTNQTERTEQSDYFMNVTIQIFIKAERMQKLMFMSENILMTELIALNMN